MKRILCIVFFIFLISHPAFGATVWTTGVTENGSGGACENGGECSASEFNALSGDYGGSTFNFSGTFTTRIVIDGIYGNSGAQLILDGYSGGDLDPINDCDNPSDAEDCDGNTASAADLTDGMYIGNQTSGPDYITVQDFRMTNQVGDDDCLQIYAGSEESVDHSIFQRLYLRLANSELIYLRTGKYNIFRNMKAVHYGQSGNPDDGFNFTELENSLITGVEWGHNNTVYPSGASSAELVEFHRNKNVLVEYSDFYGAVNQTNWRPKENGLQEYLVFRFNKNHDATAHSGMHIYGYYNQHIYIYGNFFYNHPQNGIYVRDDSTYIWIWSNLFINNLNVGLIITDQWGVALPNHMYVYNNTFARNGRATASYPDQSALSLNSGPDNNVKNNIFSDNNPLGTDSLYHQIKESYDESGLSLEHNTYYHSGDTATWRWNGDSRSYAYMTGLGYEDDAPAGNVADPGFTDPDGADTTHGTDDDIYTLQSGSPSIDNGENLSECFNVDFGDGDSWFETNSGYESPLTICLYEALDPTSDWTVNASQLSSNVSSVNQNLHGTAWERGAYAYPTSGLTITVSPTDPTATEASQTTGTYTISCSPDCAGETINFTLTGTATLDTDYDLANGEDVEDGDITITGASDTITLTPVDDSSYDPGEVAILTITTGSGYAVGSPSQASISITDDDAPPVAGNPLGAVTLSPSGSGKFVFDPTGTGGYSK